MSKLYFLRLLGFQCIHVFPSKMSMYIHTHIDIS